MKDASPAPGRGLRLSIFVDTLTVQLSYSETRIICFGLLRGRMVVIGYTQRDSVRHVFSMRRANDREQTRLAPYLGF